MQPQQTNPVMQPKQNKPWYKKWWVITIFVLAGLSTLSTATTEESTNSNQAPVADEQQNKIKYIQPEWKITNTEVVGVNYIVASGYLINNGPETGVADCNIEFYDREVKWAGGKGFGGQELQPGQRHDFTVQVEVKNTGLIAKQNIHCEDGVY